MDASRGFTGRQPEKSLYLMGGQTHAATRAFHLFLATVKYGVMCG